MNTEKLSNEAETPALNKGAVSNRYMLLKMKVNKINGWETKWHLRNMSGVGQSEYTICGISWVDGDADIRDQKFIKSKMGGKITCPECLQLINWCKSLV